MTDARTVSDVVCPACGCLCDDLTVTVEANRVTGVEGGCERGKAWFLAGRDAESSPSIDGKPAPLDAAISAAAELLTTARLPLVYLLDQAPNEAYRVAVGVADRLGAAIDSATSSAHAPAILALQSAGRVTATFGETRHRADLIVFWGADVEVECPRFIEKYVDAPGMFMPRGRADRHCVVVGQQPGPTALAADAHLPLHGNADLEAFAILRALLRGVPLDEEIVQQQTGVALAVWRDLIDRMKSAQYGALVSGRGLTGARNAAACIEQMHRLVAELNDHARFVCQSIGAAGNLLGADNVLTWQTGFPMAVDLARGVPRYSPGEFSAEQLLMRGEVDAALVVGGDPNTWLSAAALARLQSIPSVNVGSAPATASSIKPAPTASNSARRIAIPTATLGLHTAGTVVRSDDISLRTRAVLDSSLPSEVEALQRVAAAIDATTAR